MASRSTSHGRTSFGGDARAYDCARPPYPDALILWLAERCDLSARTVAFEIGAGTGLATRAMLELPVQSVLAIEPDARLAEVLREACPAEDSGRLSVLECSFQDAVLEGGDFDFGYAATSMHWLPRGRSLAKARDALRPDGGFAMWWHVFHDPEQPDAFDNAIADLFQGLEEGAGKGSGRRAFALDVAARLGELRAAGFEDCEHRLFEQEIVFDGAGLAALYATFSRVSVAPDEVRSRLLAGVEAAARDQFGDRVVRKVKTSAFIGRRR